MNAGLLLISRNVNRWLILYQTMALYKYSVTLQRRFYGCLCIHMQLEAIQFNGDDKILMFSCSDVINEELGILYLFLACFWVLDVLEYCIIVLHFVCFVSDHFFLTCVFRFDFDSRALLVLPFEIVAMCSAVKYEFVCRQKMFNVIHEGLLWYCRNYWCWDAIRSDVIKVWLYKFGLAFAEAYFIVSGVFFITCVQQLSSF